MLLIKKSVYLEKKATRKKIFNLQHEFSISKINFQPPTFIFFNYNFLISTREAAMQLVKFNVELVNLFL